MFCTIPFSFCLNFPLQFCTTYVKYSTLFLISATVYITGIYNRHFVCFPRFDITYSDMLTILNAIEYSIIISCYTEPILLLFWLK